MIKAPEPLPEDEMKKLVSRYRSGDDSVRDAIIMHHIRLCYTIASRYSGYNEDMFSAGLLGLVDGVNKAKYRLKDNNITPYIALFIKRYIIDHVTKDHNVVVGRKSYKKGCRYIPEKRNEEYEECFGLDDYIKVISQNNYNKKKICEGLAQGYPKQVIAQKLGLSPGRVSQIITDIQDIIKERNDV